MGVELLSPEVDDKIYAQAWQRCGRPDERWRQIAMTIDLGHALDRLTRKPLLRSSLRMMRGPAQAAGLGELQRLLERGFEAFGSMRGAEEFLATVERHETKLANSLFASATSTLTSRAELA